MGLYLKDIGLMDRTLGLVSLRLLTTKCMKDYGYRINPRVYVYSVELTVQVISRLEMALKYGQMAATILAILRMELRRAKEFTIGRMGPDSTALGYQMKCQVKGLSSGQTAAISLETSRME